ncbi:hypothetical protein JNUCC0626_33110 [Lentzea sp. JNUCC 0626]|uniref:hypothetical protein n=1 Tax=Lentzea sp. JNUCC 0626 TaxID=3367513 RepID=UPI00374A66C4
MEDGRRNVRPARLLSALAVVVALAGVAFGGWLIWGGQPLPASARNLEPTGEEGRRAADPLAVADFESGLESYAFVRSWPEIENMQFLSPVEIETYEAGGAGAARVAVSSRRPEGKVIAAVVQLRDRNAAIAAANALDAYQFEAGFERRYPVPTSVQRQAEVFPVNGTSDPERKPVVRVHYVHGNLVVRLELHANTAEDVRDRFGALLERQLKVLPADG